MRILSLKFNAASGTTPEKFVQALFLWLNTNKYVALSNTEIKEFFKLEDFKESSKSFSDKKCMVKFRRFIYDDKRYFAMRFENNDTDNNFNWIVDTIFVQSETVSESGSFYITLSRNPINESKPFNVSMSGYPPYIINLLFNEHLICKDTNNLCLHMSKIASTACPQVVDYIQKHLTPLVDFTIEKTSLDDGIALCIQSPKLTKDIEYTTAEISRDTNIVINRINLYVFHILNETQKEKTIVWEDLETMHPDNSDSLSEDEAKAFPTLTKYCYMNDKMAEKIKMRRKNLGLSQNELAQKVNSSGLIISRLETLRVQRVLKSTLNEIELALGLPLNSVVSMQHQYDSEQNTDKNYGLPAQHNKDDDIAPVKSGYCRYCGSELYSDSIFCSHCGTKVIK